MVGGNAYANAVDCHRNISYPNYINNNYYYHYRRAIVGVHRYITRLHPEVYYYGCEKRTKKEHPENKLLFITENLAWAGRERSTGRV